MVCLRVGAQSLHLVLVNSLDMGHDIHATRPCLHIPDSYFCKLGRMARLDFVWRALRSRSAREPDDARIPSLLRSLDLAAAVSPRPSFLGRCRAFIHRLLCYPVALGLRNYKTFGRFVFLRDDFGLQVRLGNGPSADGMFMSYLQPNLNNLELQKFQTMGELAYAESCKHQAFEWIFSIPLVLPSSA